MDNHNDIALAGCYRKGNRVKGRRTLSYTVLFTLLLSITFLPGCSPKVTREIRTEIQYRDRVVPITATFNIPYFVEKNVTKDTSSHLENPYAKSDAIVSGGMLFHSLESIPQTIETTVEVHVTDTLWKESEIRTETVEVERKFTWWEKVRLRSFWWLLVAVIALLAWVFRKPLMRCLGLR